MRTARHYVVRGRVQGVGYRYFAIETALRLGVHGYVRNLASGEVEVHAEGEARVLDEFRAELEQGPTMARVSGIVEQEASVKPYTSFSLRG